MRAVCLLVLLVPAACLNVNEITASPAHPRYAVVGENMKVEVAWQRPNGAPVGTFLWLHGCGNKALDTWAQKGHDGFEFKECNNTKKGYCAGLPQEGLMKSIARKRGYVVIAVQGGASSSRGCFHEEDVPRIKAAINHVYTVEKLGKLPMIMTGMSAGGRTLGELAGSSGGAGVPMKCAAVIAAELNQKAIPKLPKTLPIGFWHYPKDAVTETLVKKNLAAMRNKKNKDRIVEDVSIYAAPITKEFLMAGGNGLTDKTATKVIDAFKKAELLNESDNLKLDPYNPKPKTRWMKAIEQAGNGLKDEIPGGFAQQSHMTKLMERSWASHALAGDKVNDIIDFCEKH